MTALLVALGAAVGAPLRFLLASWWDRPEWACGTFAVNTSGSLLLGLLAGASVDGDALALLGTGLCGGFTTYSSFAVQTHAAGPRRGGLYAAATIGCGLAACALGFVVVA
ncbi:CrcB family protein [Nocardioides sp. SYSU D00038]|uniref:fluoride efflux transporter FluC n=1 Tax=Nocardioides sp. SYSU D00038 TaxID=2812554 RepID=UPI0019675DA0|nr:CrcB family protein [Nocardioides sp. SYSU D00038]